MLLLSDLACRFRSFLQSFRKPLFKLNKDWNFNLQREWHFQVLKGRVNSLVYKQGHIRETMLRNLKTGDFFYCSGNAFILIMKEEAWFLAYKDDVNGPVYKCQFDVIHGKLLNWRDTQIENALPYTNDGSETAN